MQCTNRAIGCKLVADAIKFFGLPAARTRTNPIGASGTLIDVTGNGLSELQATVGQELINVFLVTVRFGVYQTENVCAS